jgi:hypothetical protein
MPPLLILKNFKFKPIFLLATNVETIDIEIFDPKPLTIAFTLEPFVVAFTLEPFIATSTSKSFIVAFALKLVSKLVSQVCHISTTKKKTQDYEGIKQFQDRWVAHLPLAKSILDDIGNEHQVQCAICSIVEGKEKLLVFKLDSLFMHASRQKAKVPSRGVEVGSFYFYHKC